MDNKIKTNAELSQYQIPGEPDVIQLIENPNREPAEETVNFQPDTVAAEQGSETPEHVRSWREGNAEFGLLFIGMGSLFLWQGGSWAKIGYSAGVLTLGILGIIFRERDHGLDKLWKQMTASPLFNNETELRSHSL